MVQQYPYKTLVIFGTARGRILLQQNRFGAARTRVVRELPSTPSVAWGKTYTCIAPRALASIQGCMHHRRLGKGEKRVKRPPCEDGVRYWLA